jgi:hypothetical protein
MLPRKDKASKMSQQSEESFQMLGFIEAQKQELRYKGKKKKHGLGSYSEEK